MAYISKGFKKFVAVGCSHGHLANPKALETVLKFCDEYKPHTKIHLGDFTDQAAFRSGAQGTTDETVSIADDLAHGLNFLKAFHPQYLLNGNHEIRLWKLAEHHNQIIHEAASSVITDIREVATKMKAHYVEHYDVTRSWIQLGDTKFAHGWWFNEQAVRDHAEHFGNIVIAHLHVVQEAAARRSDNARGYCVGTLADIPKMSYALNRRATSRWSHGLAYGEYNDRECRVWLSQGMAGSEKGWKLPV